MYAAISAYTYLIRCYRTLFDACSPPAPCCQGLHPNTVGLALACFLNASPSVAGGTLPDQFYAAAGTLSRTSVIHRVCRGAVVNTVCAWR